MAIVFDDLQNVSIQNTNREMNIPREVQRAIREERMMTERMKNIDVAKIYELWHEYTTACHRGDLERWLSLWIEDGIQMAPDAPERINKEQIRAAMHASFVCHHMTDMIINIEEVRILGDWAYSYGTYTFARTPKASGDTLTVSGKFLDILQRQADGSWKIAIDCHNENKTCS